MKKIMCVIFAAVMSMVMYGCGKSDNVNAGATPPDISDEPQLPTYPEVPENPEVPEEPNEPAPEDPAPEPPAPEDPAPEPPAPEEPKPATDSLIMSTVNGLNIRSGAGTSYSSIGVMDKSDMVMPVRKAGSWYEILYKNTVGYVSASYVKTVEFSMASGSVEKVITEGKKLLGIPYVFGAPRYHWGNGALNTAFTGKSYDCSSLMQYIFKTGANVNLAMTSREQSLQGAYVPKNQIKRGDLLFFTNDSRYNNTGIERIGHVALYLGDNIILHTASDYAVIEPISAKRDSYFITARRVI